MSYKLEDVKHETPNFWVLDLHDRGYEVYRKGGTHSTRCAQIGWPGAVGLEKAIAECERRQKEYWSKPC